MRNRYPVYIAFFVSLFIFISLFKNYFDVLYIPFWVGGLVGVFLPDVDQLIYIYFIKPHEGASRKASKLIEEVKVKEVYNHLKETQSGRRTLVFHTASFQIIFLLFSFFVVSSGGSVLGSGLVLGFLIHLIVDQLTDLLDNDNLSNWFVHLKVKLDKRQTSFYWFVQVLALLVMGFLF